jgi:2'-5' RNA ligase
MPLGQFQWSMWDNKRTGPGTHQDHSPLKVWNPTDWRTHDWHNQLAPMKGEQYIPPEWWELTKPARQHAAAEWVNDQAANYPMGQVPWSLEDAPAGIQVQAAESADEVHLTLDVPENIRIRLARWLATLDLSSDGLLSPNEYHITVAYAEHGIDDPLVQSIPRRYNLSGVKFESKGLSHLQSGDGPPALVFELESDTYSEWADIINDRLKELGVDVATYPGGYTPHITLGYTEELPTPESLPVLSFRSGSMSFSIPRGAPQLEPFYA